MVECSLQSSYGESGSVVPDLATLKSLGMDDDDDYESGLGIQPEATNPFFTDEYDNEMYDSDGYDLYDSFDDYDEYDEYDDVSSDTENIDTLNDIGQEKEYSEDDPSVTEDMEDQMSSTTSEDESNGDEVEPTRNNESIIEPVIIKEKTPVHTDIVEESIVPDMDNNDLGLDEELDTRSAGDNRNDDEGETEEDIDSMETIHSGIVVESNKRQNFAADSIQPMMLLKLGKHLLSTPRSVQLFASFTAGNYIFRWISLLLKKPTENNDMNEKEDLSSMKSTDVFEGFDDDDEDESDYVNDFGFGRPRPAPRESSLKIHREMDGETETREVNEHLTSDASTQRGQRYLGNRILPWRRGNDEQDVADIPLSTQRIGLFGRRKHIKEQLKNIHQMGLDLAHLRERAERAEMMRDDLQRSGEKATMQIQDYEKQLNELHRTNVFLKSQLRDNKRILERAVNAERQKTNEELRRVRDSMVTVLEQERRIMRAQIMKTSAEVRSMLEQNEADVDEEVVYEDQYETQRG